MNENGENTVSTSRTGWLAPIVLLAYCAWVIWQAAGSGVFKWGGLGYYSLYPYVLVLGLLSSGSVAARGRSGGVKWTFLLLFLGYGIALDGIQPLAVVPPEMRWIFDFISFVTGFTVINAGILHEQGRQPRE